MKVKLGTYHQYLLYRALSQGITDSVFMGQMQDYFFSMLFSLSEKDGNFTMTIKCRIMEPLSQKHASNGHIVLVLRNF